MAREARRRQRGGDVREPGECRGGSGGASHAARRPGLQPPSGSQEANWRPAREQKQQQRRRLRRVSCLPFSLSRGRPGGPGGWRGVRCPRMGILFTRIWRLFNHQGEGRGPRAYGWGGGGSALAGWVCVVEGGVSEYFRIVGGTVARRLRAGSRLRGCGPRVRSVPTPEFGNGFFVIRDRLEKSFLQMHPLLRFRFGVEKVSCRTSDVPEWDGLAYLVALLPLAIGFLPPRRNAGSRVKVIGYGPSRNTERRRVAECGKHEESLLSNTPQVYEPSLHLHPPLWED